MQNTSSKARIFWPVLLVLVLADFGTKRLAEDRLTRGVPHEVAGEVVRFSLGYNPGAAFGMSLGRYSRPFFLTASIVALGVLFSLYRRTQPTQRMQTLALSLVAAGAVGNLIDRLRSSRGVVDFIDIGVGDVRFWTFNVADSAITVGAILLLITMWHADAGDAEAGTRGAT